MNAALARRDPRSAQPDASPLDPLTAVYVAQYRRLLAVAWRCLGEGYLYECEDVVQEAYLRARSRWEEVDPQRGVAYLCQAVANVARSAVRRRVVADRHRSPCPVVQASAEDTALSLLLPAGVVAAVRGLPGRQREALVLRHYVGLPVEDAAAVMGCSPGAVRAYTSRGLSALATQLPGAPSAARAA